MSQNTGILSAAFEGRGTFHTLIIGDCREMREIADNSIHLVVHSPPYFSAPHDYRDMFPSYPVYLDLLRSVAKELWRVVAEGRIVALIIDDMLVDGVKYPIVADAIGIYQSAGFTYRDRIIWKKPDGYVTRSRRSGVLVQNPYPMYYYPDNLLESILIFQKGKFNYKSIHEDVRERSRKQIEAYLQKNRKWHLNLWEITNVLPNSKLEKGIAAFPHELANRLITLYSYEGETVLDCFVGSGTTMKAALELQRNSIGVEIDSHLLPTIRKKIRSAKTTTPASFITIERLTPPNNLSPKPVATGAPPQSNPDSDPPRETKLQQKQALLTPLSEPPMAAR
jgi:DNA modification methylase